MMHLHRPTYEVKIFLLMNLGYELIKCIKRNSCIDIQIIISMLILMVKYNYVWYICIIVDCRVGIFPFGVKKCYVTDTLLPHGAMEVSSF